MEGRNNAEEATLTMSAGIPGAELRPWRDVEPLVQAGGVSAAAFATRSFRGVDPAEEVAVVAGDLAASSLELEIPLVVLGSLHVTGGLVVHEHAHLVVLGDAAGDAVACTAALFVAGSLRATQLVYLCSGNDFRTHIGGTVDTPLLIENGMRTHVGTACSGTIVSLHNIVEVAGVRVPHDDRGEQRLQETLVPELWEPDENGNGGLHENLLELVARGAVLSHEHARGR